MVRRDCIISVRSMHIELIEKFFAQIKKVFPLQIDSKRDEALSYYYWNHVQFDAKSIAQIGPRRIPRSTYLHPMSLSPEAVTTWGHARHDVLAAPSHVQSTLFLFNRLTWQSTAKQVVGKQTNGMFHILLFFFFGRERKFVDDISVNKRVDKGRPSPRRLSTSHPLKNRKSFVASRGAEDQWVFVCLMSSNFSFSLPYHCRMRACIIRLPVWKARKKRKLSFVFDSFLCV